MRKLVSVQTVKGLFPIPGADKIEMAQVLGWELVVKKGEFAVGDLCVFGEIDSIFPAEDPHFAFLEGKRLKTVKLRGQVSQGIAFPLSVLPQGEYGEGDDVTELLGVTKYEPDPFNIVGDITNFPHWIIKTDEERIQTCPELVAPEFAGQNGRFTATEKLDGTSATYYLNLAHPDHPFGVCSRGQEILVSDKTFYWRIARQHDLRAVLEGLAEKHGVQRVVLQGEIVGEGVQKNKYKLQGLRLYAFNLLLDGKKHLAAEIGALLAGSGIESVPVLSEDFVIPATIPELVKLAEGPSALCPATRREGIVVRSENHRVSFKVINPQFLLKYDA